MASSSPGKSLFQRHLTSYFPVATLNSGSSPPNESPATRFLREIVEISDSLKHCERHFAKKGSGEFTKDSEDSYQCIMASSFAVIMSHFETFQRHQFAELVTNADFMSDSDDTALAKALEKLGCQLSLARLLASRGQPREPGYVIADALTGWHDPSKVNQYFALIVKNHCLYSNEISDEISLMWQLRHSIVHTGGVITREDSLKVPALNKYMDKRLKFERGFIYEGKPPALLGDSQSLTVPGVPGVLVMCDRSK